MTLCFHHFNSTCICFFRVFTLCKCGSLHGYIAGGIDVLFADILFLGLDGRCRKRVFGKSIDNGNIHSCFCKFAFLKLFAIAADCIRTQNWEAKKEVYIKSRKIRNRIVELLRKFACICTPCLCFYVASSGMGKNYYFSKRCFPCMLPASGWPHFFHYLLLRPSSFLGCLHFFSQQNSLKVICKKKTSCKNKLPARN